MTELLTLDELAEAQNGWPWNESDDRAYVTELDVDYAAELAAADADAAEFWENERAERTAA